MALGKSTFARIISGITKPSSGSVLVQGIDTKDKKQFTKLRRACGIVFQNPDSQIIFNNVYDDIEFALDNLKIDDKEAKIKSSLKEVRYGKLY